MNELSTINVGNAQLPAAYQNAKTALSNCVSIDECQNWADKAAALASYAKQAKDEELMKMAIRIRDRAIRRAGELLKQIDGQGRRTDQLTEGDHGKLTQREAASQAGLSEHQQLQAVRVANVPQEDFDRLVESDTPPTVTKLSEMGTKSMPDYLNGRTPEEFNRALHFVAGIESYVKELREFDALAILPTLSPAQVERVRKAVSAADIIHDQIITRL